MADLTINSVSEAGQQVSWAAAAAGGDKAANDGRVILLVKNGGASSVTVTVTKQVTSIQDPSYGDVSKADASQAIAAGEEGVIGPFSPLAYNDGNGDVNISYSATTSVEISALKLVDLKR